MIVAAHQTPGVPESPRENLEHLAQTAAKAAARGARLLVLPEMWLTGYNIGDAAHALAEPVDGPSAERVAAIARDSNLGILYGYPERAGDQVYNAAQMIGPDGTSLTNMRKAHLYGEDERQVFMQGDTGLPVVDFEGVKIAVMICYDVEFPEAVREVALCGAEVVAVPTALFEPHRIVATHMVPVRAWENQVYVVYANRCGREGGLSYVGGSSICAPDGSRVAGAGEDECLFFGEIDPGVIPEARRENPYLTDRRPELYNACASMRRP